MVERSVPTAPSVNGNHEDSPHNLFHWMRKYLTKCQDIGDEGCMSTILVVEDEADIGFLILQKFRKQVKAGTLSFVFTSNGIDALNLLQHTSPEHMPPVALVDIKMPLMDGLTLLANLRQRFPAMKAIIVTAYGDAKHIRRAMDLGAFAFLQKPIDFADLDATITRALEEATTQPSETPETG
jgi:adenylate cyclase